MHAVEDLVGRQGISNYVSDPLLQGLQSPISELFPEQGEAAPRTGNLSLTELPLGRFRLSYEVTGVAGPATGQGPVSGRAAVEGEKDRPAYSPCSSKFL